MQSVKAHLLSVIARAAGVEPGQIHLEHPEVENHGDYSSNIALILKGGRPLAEKIAAVITPDEIIEKTEVAGPGFVNIWLQKSYLVKELQRVLKENDGYGRSDDGKGKRVIIDYSAPNIAKRFGIGHLRSTIIGQAIYNLHRYLGYEVIGDNHLGDWGTQFGKLLYTSTHFSHNSRACASPSSSLRNHFLASSSIPLFSAACAWNRTYSSSKRPIDNSPGFSRSIMYKSFPNCVPQSPRWLSPITS